MVKEVELKVHIAGCSAQVGAVHQPHRDQRCLSLLKLDRSWLLDFCAAVAIVKGLPASYCDARLLINESALSVSHRCV